MPRGGSNLQTARRGFRLQMQRYCKKSMYANLFCRLSKKACEAWLPPRLQRHPRGVQIINNKKNLTNGQRSRKVRAYMKNQTTKNVNASVNNVAKTNAPEIVTMKADAGVQINYKGAKAKTSYKCAANSTLKIEMKSLRACLNVLKQATDDDKDGIRAYIAECGLTIGLVKRIKPVDIENYTQKSKSGSYCPWYVLGALKKAAANGLEDAIKTREAAEKETAKAAK